jgi:hypothetical protein
MIQSFCKDLNRAKMNHILTHDTNEYNIHLTSEITNPNAIRLKCRSNSNGIVVTATGSVRLHIPPETIFHFLSDEKRRPKVRNDLFGLIKFIHCHFTFPIFYLNLKGMNSKCILIFIFK